MPCLEKEMNDEYRRLAGDLIEQVLEGKKDIAFVNALVTLSRNVTCVCVGLENIRLQLEELCKSVKSSDKTFQA